MNYCIVALACFICSSSISHGDSQGGSVPKSSSNVSLEYFLNNYNKLSHQDISYYFHIYGQDILNKYSSLNLNQKDFFNFLFSLPPEIYLGIWESIADKLNPDNPSHMLAVNDLFNDPLYGYTRSFFGLNWKQKSIRTLCEQLKNKLEGHLSWTNDLNRILQGEAWKDVARNGLNNMAVKIPSAPLPRKGYATQFKHWTGNGDIQEKLIRELAEAQVQFTRHIWKTKTEQDLELLYKKGLQTPAIGGRII